MVSAVTEATEDDMGYMTDLQRVEEEALNPLYTVTPTLVS